MPIESEPKTMRKIDRPFTTLFMLISLDGKISTGDADIMDTDTDYRKIIGIKEGLQQYYDLEKKTDLHFLITGKTMAKKCKSLDANNQEDSPKKLTANCIIIDNNNLRTSGIEYLLKKFNSLTVVTSNKLHPASKIKADELEVIRYAKKINFPDLFRKLKSYYGIKRLTIQSGGTLNTVLLRNGLIDRISIVIAPCLIGGKNTASLIDGESLHTKKDLKNIKTLKLIKCNLLQNNFINLIYKVVNR